MSTTRDLTTGSIPGHFRRLAVPAAIGMVFATLYNLVDTKFAGYLSTDAVAGLSISFPVFMILVALGSGLSSGMSALVGNDIGRKDPEHARRTACQGIAFSAIASVCIAIAGLWFGPLLLSIIAKPGLHLEAANAYILVILLATPSFIMAFGANGVLQAGGDTVSMQRGQIGAFFANLVLNPLFIFGIPGVIDGMGFTGLALSTVVSQTGVAIWILWRVFHLELMAGVCRREFLPHLKTWSEILEQSLPASFTMLVMLIAGFVVQFWLQQFGPEAQAAYGVALRIEQLLLLPAFGLTGALLPIAAQNFGAGNHDRVREAFRFCMITGAGFMLGASVLLWLAGGAFIRAFIDDADVARIGAQYLAVDGFILPIYVMLFAINSLLQALKKPLWSLWIGIYRQGVAVGFFIWLLVGVLEFSTWGVWLGIALAVVTGFFVSFYIVHRLADRMMGGLFAPNPSRLSAT